MKKQFFAFAFMVTMVSNVIAYNERSMFDETSEASKWTYVESKFVTKIADEKKTIWAHFTAAATALAAVTAGSQLWLNQNNLNDKFSDNMFTKGNVYGAATALTGGTFVVSALDCYVATQANRNAIDNFFSNWKNNQAFVPAELQAAFELIAESMTKKGKNAVLHHANEIVETIQFIVTRHFESRYKGTLETKARNALAETKTTTEIIKIFTDAAKNLGGGK